MKRLIIAAAISAAALTFSAITDALNAKDMFYALAARWCSTEWDNKPHEFEILGSGVLYDGARGEAPVCKLKRASEKNEAFAEHIVTWQCDPHPAHEPEDRPTPKFKFYEVTERLLPFIIHDSSGGRRFFLMRDKLPLGRGRVGIYEMCRDEAEPSR
jgi:hypothetical protein